MGLSHPVTHLQIHEEQDELYTAAVASMQGYRPHMEDEYSMCVNGKAMSYFAVYDGHAGGVTSAFLRDNLDREILKPRRQSLSKHIYSCVLRVDSLLREQKLATEKGGSTGVFACVQPIPGETDIDRYQITVGNVGDSRCILCHQDGTFTQMSWDHKPTNSREIERIIGAGGFVRNMRVSGDLAMSRAFGDFTYKNLELAPEHQMVSVCPEIVSATAHTSDILVLACDGIWDVMTNEAVAEFVLDATKEGQSSKEIAQELIFSCLELGSQDNMTAFIIQLGRSDQKTESKQFIPGHYYPDSTTAYQDAYRAGIQSGTTLEETLELRKELERKEAVRNLTLKTTDFLSDLTDDDELPRRTPIQSPTNPHSHFSRCSPLIGRRSKTEPLSNRKPRRHKWMSTSSLLSPFKHTRMYRKERSMSQGDPPRTRSSCVIS